MSRVVEELKISRRFPVRSTFKNIKSSLCPICGAPLNITITSIERREDDSLWVSWEEYCTRCEYDKVYGARFYPRYTGLQTEFYG